MRKKSHLQIPEPVCDGQSIWIRWSGATGGKRLRKRKANTQRCVHMSSEPGCSMMRSSAEAFRSSQWNPVSRQPLVETNPAPLKRKRFVWSHHQESKEARREFAWAGSTMNKPVAVWRACYKPHHYVHSVESWSWAKVQLRSARLLSSQRSWLKLINERGRKMEGGGVAWVSGAAHGSSWLISSPLHHRWSTVLQHESSRIYFHRFGCKLVASASLFSKWSKQAND